MDKIDLKKIEKCYLLYGEDSFTRKAWEDKIRKKIVDEASEMMNMTVFNDIKTTAGQIIEAAETFPFMSEKRIIIARDCGFFSEGKKAESDLLAEYIEKIPDTACIVFSEEKADKRMKLYKAAEKHGIVKTYNGLKDVDLANMIEKKFAKSGIKATKAVCVYMVRNCGENAETLKNETDKIISYLGDRNEVKTEDIDKLCSKSSETKVFDLVDAMIAGKTEKALEIYRTLLSLNESPYMVLSLITRQFRIILKCKSLSESGLSGSDMAKKIGVAPFVANGAVRQSRNFSYEMLKASLNKCLETDYLIKTGKTEPVSGVEMLIANGAL